MPAARAAGYGYGHRYGDVAWPAGHGDQPASSRALDTSSRLPAAIGALAAPPPHATPGVVPLPCSHGRGRCRPPGRLGRLGCRPPERHSTSCMQWGGRRKLARLADRSRAGDRSGAGGPHAGLRAGLPDTRLAGWPRRPGAGRATPCGRNVRPLR